MLNDTDKVNVLYNSKTLEKFRISPPAELIGGNKVNLYNGLVAMVRKNNVERRKNSVFKHGIFPGINIVMREASGLARDDRSLYNSLNILKRVKER